jgi:formylglycine-generating enzyme required for sulfatase activity
MRITRASQALGGVAACVALGGCSDIAPARSQLVVVVDTDAHLVAELATAQNVSADATIDTLRIDVFDSSGTEYDAHTLVVSAPSTWPVSFGIEPPKGGSGSVLLRIRAFRALFAEAGTVNGGQPTLDPLAEVTIDRLVAASFPASGVETAAVTLATDCMGTPVTFGAHKTTCIDANQTMADPQDGISSAAISVSKVGTWAPAFDVACASQPGANQVCIDGGFAILGDLNDIGTTAAEVSEEPVPLRPVVVAPFWLDETEFTVGHLRQLVQAGSFTATLPTTLDDPSVDDSAYCTWLGMDQGANDMKPINCIGSDAAALACKLSGARLPTEVEWEYAARGRGQRLSYPWGDEYPQCCTASLSRLGPVTAVQCEPASGVEPVGSHPISAACGGTGDVSRDNVMDMGGSLIEVVSTMFAPYTDPCWAAPAILRAPPQCTSGTVPAARGSFWNGGLATAFGARRDSFSASPTTGFRCASDGAAP